MISIGKQVEKRLASPIKVSHSNKGRSESGDKEQILFDALNDNYYSQSSNFKTMFSEPKVWNYECLVW